MLKKCENFEYNSETNEMKTIQNLRHLIKEHVDNTFDL